jgi:hypothetical protein
MDGNVKTLYEFKDRVNFLFRSNHYLYAVIGRYNMSKPETCSYIRVDLNDGTDTKLGNYYFSDYYTAVSGGNIYWNDKNKIYSMSIDGKNKKELFQGYANKLVAFNSAVYFNYDPNTVRQPNSLSNNVYDLNVHTGKSKTLARYADNEITTHFDLLGQAGKYSEV